MKKSLLASVLLVLPCFLIMGTQVQACNHDDELKEKTRRIQVRNEQADQNVLPLAATVQFPDVEPRQKHPEQQTPDLTNERRNDAGPETNLNFLRAGWAGGSGVLMLLFGGLLVFVRNLTGKRE